MATRHISKAESRYKVLRMVVIPGSILLIPLVAMQLTSQVEWTLLDFFTAGVLLFGTALIYETLINTQNNKQRKMAASLILAAVFMYLWAEFAVGILTNWGS